MLKQNNLHLMCRVSQPNNASGPAHAYSTFLNSSVNGSRLLITRHKYVLLSEDEAGQISTSYGVNLAQAQYFPVWNFVHEKSKPLLILANIRHEELAGWKLELVSGPPCWMPIV